MSYADFASFGISRDVYDRSEQALTRVEPVFTRIRATRASNQLRVIQAMREVGLAESALGGTTGYGYDDRGREQIEQVYAHVFGAEAALVRLQISSGTQAISACLFGLLRPGDELLSVTGTPYDTLLESIGQPGQTEDKGSLADFGITYRQVELSPDGSPDADAIRQALQPRTRVVLVQKSRGYSTRRSLRHADLASIVEIVRSAGSRAIIMTDNCYGEFVETQEPCHAGVDLCAGSLIKNPGGGLCPSGGYIAGRADLVEKVAVHLSAPGLGSHVGPTLGFNRLIAQGFYLAPLIVAESLKGAVFAAAMLELSGFTSHPGPDDPRGDLIQSVLLGGEQKLIQFCQAIQAASPVDSFVQPEPWPMPGYQDPVIMAAGTFVQGASIELSADGPLRPPYPAYLQGGLSFDQVRLAIMMAVEKMEHPPR
ncbi:MAG: methionine gamma-lyase family protein [Eubacteriales bacterium]|nr:methionine gamma-lyase family protein [Eubacteriales bacterium]MDD3866330.1 methionine gamma-lyase family protein [Eubacteriales bacterium]MDD4460783.1 methionine gamma-lyase family protein [Eubacteriales bacterium]